MDEQIPESRNYTHTSCGNTTSVSGNDFTALADPFSVVPATFCVACNKHFPLNEFTWDDTDELISDARARLALIAPPWARLASGRVGCGSILLGCVGMGIVGGLGLGLFGGWLKWICPITGALLGAMIAVILFSAVLNPFIMRRFYNVSDPRLLK